MPHDSEEPMPNNPIDARIEPDPRWYSRLKSMWSEAWREASERSNSKMAKDLEDDRAASLKMYKEFLRENLPTLLLTNLAYAVLLMLGFGMAIALPMAITGDGVDVYGHLIDIVGPYAAKCLVSTLVVGAGIGAHWFKGKNLRLYGAVEFAFGTGSAINIAFRLAPGQSYFAQWASLVGCAYVIARGLNNISDARQSVPALTSTASGVSLSS